MAFSALYLRNQMMALVACVVVFGLAAAKAPAQGGFLDSLQGGGFGGPGGFGQSSDDPVSVASQFTPATADRPAVLMVTATIQPGWHVYALDQGKLPSGIGPQKTTLTLKESPSYRLLGSFRATPAAHERLDTLVFEGLTLKEHADQVTWYAPIEFTEGADPASATVEASLSLQACHDQQGCVPQSFEIAAQQGRGVPIGELDFSDQPAASQPTPDQAPAQGGGAPRQAAPATAAPAAAGPPYNLDAIRLAELAEEGSLLRNLALAFGGGLLLNLMPCVLPVIGLKVMSFVQQAGYSRGKALQLNIWYSLGILSVFWILAGLAIVAGLSWGAHFGSSGFNIVMAGIVFAMALSLMGVWEIHVPDAINQSATHDAVQAEGAAGAFFKGVVTTLLATPCTGPGLAAALFWAVSQPTHVTLATFTVMGLGMASPYLLIGAFPQLVNFLPRPGNWMVTFKQLMGFVLMGTVIFLLAQVESHLLLPTLCLLIAIGLACWVYSLQKPGAAFGERSQTYALCGAIVAAGAVFSYAWFAPLLIDEEAAWQDFTLAGLQQSAVEEGKTVLVDFGADWCTTCILLEKTVLHTEPIEKAIKANGVVPMFADFTHEPPELKQTLNALQSSGVPVIAIFPGGAPHEPIVFRGGYTQQQILDAIAQASSMKATASVAENLAPAAATR